MTQTADRNLYAVQVLKDRYLCVRSVDLAHYLGISKASVSTFIRRMRQQGLIEVEPDRPCRERQITCTRCDLIL